MSTVAQLLASRTRLQSVSDSPALDIELLLCHCLGKERSFLKAWPEAEVTPDQAQHFQNLLARRELGEPIAYLVGHRGFWSFDVITNPSTLIPRPETELLVEKSLVLLADKPTARVLDLGTGTGAIALALASECPDWQVLASDVQPEAVKLAEQNRQRLGLENVSLIESDWFNKVAAQQFDLIVSNPPYIDPEDSHLTEGDVRFEPISALVAGRQGFADIETIITQAKNFLVDGGWLLFEHGYNQGQGARERLVTAAYTDVFTVLDLAGQERVSGGCYHDTGNISN